MVPSLIDDLQRIRPLVKHGWLRSNLEHARSMVQRDAYIIGYTSSICRKPLQDIVLVDYGGGGGWLSILAKKLGVGIVIYNDISPNMCEGAKKIAGMLACRADYYVKGDIHDLINFCDKRLLKADAIISNDVIEHIYDIDDFFSNLHLISHEGTIMWHGTDANPFWYPFEASVPEFHSAAESCFRSKRIQIILEQDPNLSEEVVYQLSSNTRGLLHSDIVNAVELYKTSGELPKLMEHPTNTCDPYTGYYEERSMNPYYLKETLSFNGFYAELQPMPWQEGNTFQTNIMGSALNFLMHVLGANMSLYLSPEYSICAQYNGHFSNEAHLQHLYSQHKSPRRWLVMVPYKVLSLLHLAREFYPFLKNNRSFETP